MDADQPDAPMHTREQALPAIRHAVGPDMHVFYDTGVRSGEDIVKAIVRLAFPVWSHPSTVSCPAFPRLIHTPVLVRAVYLMFRLPGTVSAVIFRGTPLHAVARPRSSLLVVVL